MVLTALAEMLQGHSLEDAAVALNLPDLLVPLSQFLVEDALQMTI